MRLSPRIVAPRVLIAALGAAVVATVGGSLAPAVSAAAPSSAPQAGTTLVVELTPMDRRVVPLGIDHGADWGDVVIESGTATGRGVSEGTFVRRGMAFGNQRLGTQEVIQMSFPQGSLVFQASGFWSGPTEAALLGGTGTFTGARGSATITGTTIHTWTITILPQRGVDPTQTTVVDYPRTLMSTSRISLAAPDSTVGNLTQTTGVLLGDDSSIAADYSAISTVVEDLPDDRERRQVQAMFEFADGTLMVNAMIVAQRTALPTSPVEYAISGGTGAYAGAAGIAEYVPGNGAGPDRWRLTRFALASRAAPVRIAPAKQVESVYSNMGNSGALNGIGDLILANGWWRSGAQPRDTWAVSAQAVDYTNRRGNERRTLLSTLQYNRGSDALLVMGLTRTGSSGGPATPVERVVIGGIGTYAGASGTVAMTPVKTGTWRTTFAVGR